VPFFCPFFAADILALRNIGAIFSSSLAGGDDKTDDKPESDMFCG